MADILKTYPLPAWQLALGELFAPAAILTCTQWLLILFSLVTFTGLPGQPMDTGFRTAIAVGLAIIAPGLNFVTLIIPNVAVLMFPGWFQTGKDAPQGIEATGQRLIFALGQAIVLLVALVPSSAMFAIIYFMLTAFLGVSLALAIPVAAIGAAVVLVGEACLGVLWLGRLFEKYDVSAETGNQ